MYIVIGYILLWWSYISNIFTIPPPPLLKFKSPISPDTPPHPSIPHPRLFKVFQSICATPSFKSRIRPCFTTTEQTFFFSSESPSERGKESGCSPTRTLVPASKGHCSHKTPHWDHMMHGPQGWCVWARNTTGILWIVHGSETLNRARSFLIQTKREVLSV